MRFAPSHTSPRAGLLHTHTVQQQNCLHLFVYLFVPWITQLEKLSSIMQSPSKKMRQEQRHPHQQHQQQAQPVTAAEFRDQAVSFLASRLMVTQHCPQAASLQLRPSLQKVQEELLSTITNAVQLKQNGSLLVLGEPGIGKTLVGSCSSSSSCCMLMSTVICACAATAEARHASPALRRASCCAHLRPHATFCKL